MANPFEALSAAAFAVTTTTFGHDAVWAPSAGGDSVSARVHFRNPTNPDRIREAGYTPAEPEFEYLPADLPGLYTSVRAGTDETVTIDGTDYTVVNVETIQDGTVYLARCAVI